MILCFIISCFIFWYRVYLYVYSILYAINYYYFCSIYAATLYVECGPIYCMPACAPALRVPCNAVINRTTAKVPLARMVWNLLAAAEFRRVRFEKLLAERCLSSYCWVVSFCASTRCGTFPQVYRGTGTLLFNVGHLLWACRVDVNVVAHRRTSSRGVFHRCGRCWSMRTISSTITGSFVKRQRKRPSRTVSSDRVVPFHLISVAERGHAIRTVHRVTCHRLSSKSECVDPRRKIVSRR